MILAYFTLRKTQGVRIVGYGSFGQLIVQVKSHFDKTSFLFFRNGSLILIFISALLGYQNCGNPLPLTVPSDLEGSSQSCSYGDCSQPPTPPPPNSQVDEIPPSGSIIINSNAQNTSSSKVAVHLRAVDNVAVVAYFLSVSADKPSISDPQWRTISKVNNYSANLTYQFSATAGEKALSVWFKDEAGNLSQRFSDFILCSPCTTVSQEDGKPVVTIFSPTASTSYITHRNILHLAGSTDDENGVREISWTNSRGGSGAIQEHTDYWLIKNISLSEGVNLITVSAESTKGHVGHTTIEVHYQKPIATNSIYIDFGAPEGGNGSQKYPFNNRNDIEPLKAGKIYFFKRGTTTYGGIVIDDNNPESKSTEQKHITIDAYGPSNLPKPKIISRHRIIGSWVSIGNGIYKTELPFYVPEAFWAFDDQVNNLNPKKDCAIPSAPKEGYWGTSGKFLYWHPKVGQPVPGQKNARFESTETGRNNGIHISGTDYVRIYNMQFFRPARHGVSVGLSANHTYLENIFVTDGGHHNLKCGGGSIGNGVEFGGDYNICMSCEGHRMKDHGFSVESMHPGNGEYQPEFAKVIGGRFTENEDNGIFVRGNAKVDINDTDFGDAHADLIQVTCENNGIGSDYTPTGISFWSAHGSVRNSVIKNNRGAGVIVGNTTDMALSKKIKITGNYIYNNNQDYWYNGENVIHKGSHYLNAGLSLRGQFGGGGLFVINNLIIEPENHAVNQAFNFITPVTFENNTLFSGNGYSLRLESILGSNIWFDGNNYGTKAHQIFVKGTQYQGVVEWNKEIWVGTDKAESIAIP